MAGMSYAERKAQGLARKAKKSASANTASPVVGKVVVVKEVK